GYRDYYLTEAGPAPFKALLGSENAGFLTLEPSEFDLDLAGAAPDLTHGVISTCAALTANATEVPTGEGCDPTKANLYEYFHNPAEPLTSAPLSLVNLLPAQSTGTPGAQLAAQSGAVSSDGSRVYFDLEGNLYLRSSGQTAQVDADAGGG